MLQDTTRSSSITEIALLRRCVERELGRQHPDRDGISMGRRSGADDRLPGTASALEIVDGGFVPSVVTSERARSFRCTFFSPTFIKFVVNRGWTPSGHQTPEHNRRCPNKRWSPA